jgi:hypothetical protein
MMVSIFIYVVCTKGWSVSENGLREWTASPLVCSRLQKPVSVGSSSTNMQSYVPCERGHNNVALMCWWCIPPIPEAAKGWEQVDKPDSRGCRMHSQFSVKSLFDNTVGIPRYKDSIGIYKIQRHVKRSLTHQVEIMPKWECIYQILRYV